MLYRQETMLFHFAKLNHVAVDDVCGFLIDSL